MSIANRLGLRARVTVFVAAGFAVMLAGVVLLTLSYVRSSIRENSIENARALLNTYLDSSASGAGLFFTNGAGTEISEDQWNELRYLTPTELDAKLQEDADRADQTPEQDDASAATTATLDSTQIEITQNNAVPGSETIIERRDGIAVTQQVVSASGEQIWLGYQVPQGVIDANVETASQVLWVSLPVLTLIVAAIAWYATGAALRHVRLASARARSIGASNIDERLPLPAAHDELYGLVDTINAMLDRIERAQTQQRQFIADASHELRSPITASRAQLDVALSHPDDADWETTANVVLAEQRHLGALVDDLLALSRLEETSPTFNNDVDLDELILAEAQRPHASTVRAEIKTPARVRADAALVHRALRNLIDNAARHSTSLVRVSLDQHHDVATIHVDDDGAGIPADRRDEIFERFTRLDEARDRERGGAGLGLAIASGVAHAHGGSLVCTDSPLGGARFTLKLPVTPTTADDQVPQGAPTPRGAEGVARRQR